jgi:hypothetical protein
MELVFKLPPNKLPFIGIVFDSSFQASSLNSDFVDLYKQSAYSISLENMGNSSIDLKLTCHEPHSAFTYKQLKYSKEKLLAFLPHAYKSESINFSHLVKRYDKETVVKTGKIRNLFVLRISHIKLLELLEDNFHADDPGNY